VCIRYDIQEACFTCCCTSLVKLSTVYALSVWLADTAGTSGALEGVSDTWDRHSAKNIEHMWACTGLFMVYYT